MCAQGSLVLTKTDYLWTDFRSMTPFSGQEIPEEGREVEEYSEEEEEEEEDSESEETSQQQQQQQLSEEALPETGSSTATSQAQQQQQTQQPVAPTQIQAPPMPGPPPLGPPPAPPLRPPGPPTGLPPGPPPGEHLIYSGLKDEGSQYYRQCISLRVLKLQNVLQAGYRGPVLYVMRPVGSVLRSVSHCCTVLLRQQAPVAVVSLMGIGLFINTNTDRHIGASVGV